MQLNSFNAIYEFYECLFHYQLPLNSVLPLFLTVTSVLPPLEHNEFVYIFIYCIPNFCFYIHASVIAVFIFCC